MCNNQYLVPLVAPISNHSGESAVVAVVLASWVLRVRFALILRATRRDHTLFQLRATGHAVFVRTQTAPLIVLRRNGDTMPYHKFESPFGCG